MYNPLQYLFFKIYQSNKRFAPKSEQPVLNSILAISLLMFCNLITLSLVIELISGFKIISFEGISVIKIVTVIVAILLLNFFLFAFKNRYNDIIDKHNKSGTIRGNLGVLIYILLSIATLLFVLLYIAGKASTSNGIPGGSIAIAVADCQARKQYLNMSVENTDVIDFISIDQEGNVVLTVSDDLEWDKENTHLLKLQNKLNAYLEAIDNGNLYESYPNAQNRNIIISVVSKHFPNADGEQFLKRTQVVLAAAGFGFKYTNLIG